jgi:hypothetical protein
MLSVCWRVSQDVMKMSSKPTMKSLPGESEDQPPFPEWADLWNEQGRRANETGFRAESADPLTVLQRNSAIEVGEEDEFGVGFHSRKVGGSHLDESSVGTENSSP